MVEGEIPIFCYWNGCIKDGPDGPCYEGSTVRVIRAKRKTKFTKLLDELHRTTGFDKQCFQLDLVGKYPTVVQPSMVKYIRLPVMDDSSVETMLEIPKLHPSISNVELYVEVKSVSSEVIDPVACSSPETNHRKDTVNHRNSSGRHNTCQSAHQEEAAGIGLSLMQETVEPMRGNLFGDMRGINGLFEDKENDAEDYDIGGNTDDDMGYEDLTLHGLSDLVANLSREHNAKEKNPGLGLFTDMGLGSNVNASDSKPSPQAMAWKLDRDLRIGITFLDMSELKKIVKAYSIKRHREYEVEEATKCKWKVRCKRGSESGCKWELRAVKRKKHGLFEISKYSGPHTCAPTESDKSHKQLGASFVADEIESLVKAEPAMSVADLIERVKEKFGHSMSYGKMWYAKQIAIENIFGEQDKTFKALPRLIAALEKSNKIIVEWQFEHVPNSNAASFHRLFWAFAQCMEGFLHCRPVISVDAVDLNGKYKGKMMVATGIDANDQVFPLAFAVTEEESFSSWHWFLSRIRQKVTQRKGLCLISNSHPDILAAVQEPASQWQEPWAYHRFCLRHICSKFDNQFHCKHLRDLVYKAGSTHHPGEYDSLMRAIERSKPEAYQWLDSIPVAQWALAHDGGRRYGIMTTNSKELFDTVLKGALDLLITRCVQLTFERLKTLFDDRRRIANESLNRGEMYTPHVIAKLQRYMTEANMCNVIPFDHIGGVFDVITTISLGEHLEIGRVKHVVQINQGSCTCGKWQIYKFPCSHVLAVCGRFGLDSQKYIEEYYTVEKYSKIWGSQFSSIRDQCHWPEAHDFPRLFPHPSYRRSEKGRRFYTRCGNEPERKKPHCRFCGQGGHTCRNCSNKIN